MCTKLCTIANVHDTWTEWVVHTNKESYTKRTPKLVGHLFFKYISELCTLNVHRTNRAHILHRKCTGKVYKMYTKSAQVMHRYKVGSYTVRQNGQNAAQHVHVLYIYYAHIMHILCTLCTHNPNCYTQYLHFVCSKICIACTMCAHCVHISCNYCN